MEIFRKISLPKILSVISILFLASCAATPEIRLNAGGVEMELTQSAPIVGSVAFSPDGRYVLTGSIDETATLWDMSSGTALKKFSAPRGFMGEWLRVAFSQDGLYGITGGKGLKIWDLSTGKKVRTIGDWRTNSIAVSPDKQSVLTGGWPGGMPFSQGHMILWDMNTGSEIIKFEGYCSFLSGDCRVSAVTLSPDGRYALSDYGSTIFLWDVATGSMISSVKADHAFFGGGMVQSVAFSPDGKYALSGGADNIVRLWNIPSLSLVKEFEGHTGMLRMGIGAVAFSPDNRYALSGGWSDGFIKIWDISTGSEVKSIKAHSSMMAVSSLAISPDGKFILSGGDASTRIWALSTFEEVAAMISFSDGEWLVITSAGYYNSSEKGAQYLNIKFEGKDYAVDQFYDVFYRPDIVAAKLQGQDIKDLITITMKDAIKSPPPTVEISSLPSTTNDPKVKVCYNAKSTGGGIGEVRLFHNGKLIESDGYYKDMVKATSEKTQLIALNSKAIYEDMRSVKIKEKAEISPITTKTKGEAFNDCKEIDAISGENEISITAFNKDNTVQGYMQTAKFNSTVKQEEPHLYILSIGIDQYKDSTITLRYAVKDSNDIKDKLIKQAETLYRPQDIHYIILKDQNATKQNITNKINELTKKIKPTDSFILFVAGHGILLQNQYYMLTSDYDGNVNEGAMISSNEIVEMSKKIKSLSQLFIFDTCHAGGVDYIVSGLYDARMSVLAKKMGLHIYASANSKEAAMDGYNGNGLFTYTLLDGLNNNRNADKNKDNKVSLTELGEYSKQTTTDISKKIGHQQTPLIINFGKDNAVYNLR